MKEMDLDEQIKTLEAGIQRMQGQLDLLLALKQAGAVVTLPEPPAQDAPPASA